MDYSQNHYTVEEKFDMIFWVIRGNSFRETRDLFSVKYPDRPIPCVKTISSTYTKLKVKGCLLPCKCHNVPKINDEAEMQEIMICAMAQEDSTITIAKLSENSGFSVGKVHKIIKQNKLKSYKNQVDQKDNVGKVKIQPVKKNKSEYEKLNKKQKMHLKKVIGKFFINHQIPNSTEIYQAVKNDINLPPISQTNFGEILKKLGFECDKKELPCTIEQIVIKKEPIEPVVIPMNYNEPRPSSADQEMPSTSGTAIKQETEEALDDNDNSMDDFDGAEQVEMKFEAEEEMFLDEEGHLSFK
ncbi:unnamed protein product [Brassicogethes aeneus]|uniref:DUF4817 domain-containing protein n=1 Tax=Brassicogethes aeneus TaxID=1431903 RepID=A0A9P0AW44_BRAAE|nr:unnamed protein product [Brassicogethes aeneus]